MASRRKNLLVAAWLASWALIFVFASSLPAWLAIGLAIATFAGFLLVSRERSPCVEPGEGACCPSASDAPTRAPGGPASD